MRRFDRLQKCLKMVFLGSGSAKHIYSTMGCDIKLWCNICQRAEGRSAVAVGTCPAALMQRNIWGKRRKIHGPWRVIGRDFSSCLERRRNWVLILTQYCLMCSPVISKFFMWKCCFFILFPGIHDGGWLARWPYCVEFARSPSGNMGFLWVV